MRLQKFIFLIVLSINCFSQSRFDLKVQRKEKLEIVNRGLDFSKDFVVICDNPNLWNAESKWETALFQKGISTGKYHIDEDDVRIIDGDYTFEISLSSIVIKDANNDFKTVATLTFGAPYSNLYLMRSGDSRNREARKSVINLLILSNKK